MRYGRSLERILIFVLIAGALSPGVGRGAAVLDPFLESFRVGALTGDGDVACVEGWPAGLLEPCRLDSAWAAAAAAYFAGSELPRDHRLLAWRIMRPALGDAATARAWFRERRARALALLAAGGGPAPAADGEAAGDGEGGGPGRDAGEGPAFLRSELLALTASNQWEAGDAAAAAATVEALLAGAGEAGLGAEEVLVWALRRQRLRQLAGTPDTTAAPWPELWDLGPYDVQGAWALWVAGRRQAGRPVLPPAQDPERLTDLLLRLRRDLPGPAALRAAGLAEPAADLLGAAALRGEELERLLDRHPEPPADPVLQDLWVGARRRLSGYDPAVTEELAALEPLAVGTRVDLWRRGAEARLIRREWERGLHDLGRALDLVAEAGDAWQDRLAEQLLQATALAAARGRAREGRRLLALAERLDEPRRRRLRLDLAEHGLPHAAAGVADAAAGTGEREAEERARRLVRGGGAAAVAAADAALTEAAVRRRREELWPLWLAWGRALLAEAPSALAAEPGWRRYGEQLDAAAAAASPPARFALACAAAGRALRGQAVRDAVGDWLLERDLAALGRGRVLPTPSPLAGLGGRVGRGARARLLRHALLGVALAAGDARGQVGLTYRLPAGSLTPAERLRFLYPLPAPGSLLTALAGCGVEAPLILAVARNESLFEPAVRSRAGALGWLQIMPFHYPEAGCPDGRPLWRQPEVSLRTGAALLAAEAARFGGDPYRTVAAYNAGAGAVARWDRQLGGAAGRNLFLAWIGYPETRRYTEKVLIDRLIYGWMLAASPGGASPGP